jgi:hypothetical protein
MQPIGIGSFHKVINVFVGPWGYWKPIYIINLTSHIKAMKR